ncbi:DUF1801 domain-containing protein [Thermoflexibacter ruber]|uniref:YdhG-like domain-containing protein n=1 Tax=Thermoflexibacter ruber TaxID=1003 RepID=A0A1I2DBG2_9BACT|nr:DUF1801 domain-containing protein [Thermoflexibacter ruber]SFE77310.1 protein of unknown function (DU1801) [Thermoflexibacter ruber]
MQSQAFTVEEYLASLPEDRKKPMSQLRETIVQNLPSGFVEAMTYGSIGYVIPHSLYPSGYHCDPKQALPFLNIASQKNFIAVYHMGIYADPTILNWFVNEYPKYSKTKLDMGKSCIRFKKIEAIPYELIGELASKISPEQWIALYEAQIKKSK